MIADHVFFTAVNILLAWSVYVTLTVGALSFASGAFMSFGCYVSGVLTVRHHWPLYPAALTAAAGAAGLGALLAIPVLRVRGIYLVLSTLGVTLSAVAVFENVDYFGGATGFGGMSGATPVDAVVVTLVVGAALFVASRSPLQRVLDAVREDEDVAASLGIDVPVVKIKAFAVSGAIASLAGSLFGHYLAFVRPDNFEMPVAISAVLAVILGGTNNMLGPAVGAAFMTLVPEYITALKDWRPTVFALLVIAALALRRDGLFARRSATARTTTRAAS